MSTGAVEWFVFLALAGTSVAAAAGMLLTMSMVRAGLALMSSFVALAGLFFLLDADLLAAVQIMMNVGGMLVMVLAMVMLMMDPGGAMMGDMKREMHMRGPGALSMRMPRGAPPSSPEAREHHEMMSHMAMSTTQLPWAIAVGVVSAVVLIALVVTTAWPIAVSAGPSRDATHAVGELLLGRYMVAFEGAAFLILGGIAGAVVLGRRERGESPSSPHEES
jgi:NADH-quinone oxidoreductase subunit J